MLFGHGYLAVPLHQAGSLRVPKPRQSTIWLRRAIIAIFAVAVAGIVSPQSGAAGIVRLNDLLEEPSGGRIEYRLGQELRPIFPVLEMKLHGAEIPFNPDGSVPLGALLDPIELPARVGRITVMVEAGESSATQSVRLTDLNEPAGADLSLPLYVDREPTNILDNAGFDQYSESLAPKAWEFDVLEGHGAFIAGTAAEPNGRTFTMDLKPRPDGTDSLMRQSILTGAIPAGGTQATASVDAFAEHPDSLYLELLLVGEDGPGQVLASVAHPGGGTWKTLVIHPDLPAGTPKPVIQFRLRRSSAAQGRTAFDNASLVTPKVYPRLANITLMSGARMNYRTRPLTIPRGGELAFGIGVMNPLKFSFLRNLEFRVFAETEDGQTPLFEHVAEPSRDRTPLEWQDQRIDLSAWSGRTVRLVFESRYVTATGDDIPESDTTGTSLPLWGDVVLTGDVVEDSHRPPNVIVISLDTLRADHLGVYGYKRDTSPALDRLAASAYVFENCFSSSSWTTPAHATAFTGLLPSVHGAGIRRGPFASRSRLPAEVTTFAERAQVRGYRTAAYTEGYYAGSRWGLGQGFDRYHDGPADPAPHSNAIGATFERASEWLRGTGSLPFLLFAHTYAAHWPYSPPEPFLSRFVTQATAPLPEPKAIIDGTLSPAEFQSLRDYYDGGIAYMDHVLGEFFNELSARGVLDDTWVIIFSDHGEEFGEHGKAMHGFTLYDEVLHVPFIVRPPGGLSESKRVSDVVALADLYGTVLRIIGDTGTALPPTSFSLLPLMTEGAAAMPDRPDVVSELVQHQFLKYFISSRGQSSKYIASTGYGEDDPVVPGSVAQVEAGLDIQYPIAVLEAVKGSTSPQTLLEEVFNLSTDPDESDNLAGSDPQLKGILRDALLRRLREIRDTVGAGAAPDLADPLSPEELERLKAIGYVD